MNVWFMLVIANIYLAAWITAPWLLAASAIGWLTFATFVLISEQRQ